VHTVNRPAFGLAVAFMLTALRPCVVQADPKGTSRPPAMLGAIRWDAWTRWASETEWAGYEKCLWPKEWHYRVPFYGKIVSDERVEVQSDTQEVMDKEIDYAVKGGLSYWAFGWYHPRGWQNADNMTRSLDLYLKSKRKSRLKYSLILMAGVHLGPKDEWPATVDYLVARFKEPEYAKVLGNRPLVYWYDMDQFVPFWGTEAAGREALRLLRERTRAAGLGEPYMALMCYWPPRGVEQLHQFGLDALSSYVNPPGSENREQPYSDAVSLNSWFWEEAKKTGRPLIPTVTAGWDYRPMKLQRYPDRDMKNNWFTTATSDELTTHVGGAMEWVRQNPTVCEANAVVIYAWNEISEGGWLVPTHSEGTRRLDAVRRAVDQARRKR
jgi:hypothetical protein